MRSVGRPHPTEFDALFIHPSKSFTRYVEGAQSRDSKRNRRKKTLLLIGRLTTARLSCLWLRCEQRTIRCQRILSFGKGTSRNHSRAILCQSANRRRCRARRAPRMSHASCDARAGVSIWLTCRGRPDDRLYGTQFFVLGDALFFSRHFT